MKWPTEFVGGQKGGSSGLDGCRCRVYESTKGTRYLFGLEYDALGMRIAKYDAVADEMTYYHHNPNWQVLAEYDDVGFLRYYIDGNYIDEPLVMHRQSDGEDYYYGHDHLYSTVVLIDDAGNVVERYEYDAYVKARITDANYAPRTASAYANPYTFTGRQLDVLDGGDLLRTHYRHRDCAPDLGRFLQQDPLGLDPDGGMGNFFSIVFLQYLDTLNLYEYVRSTPAMDKDPMGLQDPIFLPGIYPTPAVPRTIPSVCANPPNSWTPSPRLVCKMACGAAGALCMGGCGFLTGG